MIIIHSFEIYHRFLWEETVCRYSSDKVHNEIRDGTMPGMFYLGDVFQFVIDSLDYGPLANQYPVAYRPDTAPHITFQFGNQLYAVDKQFVEQILADIPPVTNKFAVNGFYERLYFQGLAVVDIAGGNHGVQYLPLVIADQVKLEAVELSQRASSPLGYALEHLVHVDALVATNTQQGAVHEADAGAFAQHAFLYEDDELNHH